MFFRVCLCLSKQFILHRFSFYWLPFLFSYFSKHGSNFCWFKDFPGGSDGKSVCLQWGRPGFSPWVRKIPWRRKWQLTSVSETEGSVCVSRSCFKGPSPVHLHVSYPSDVLIPFPSHIRVVLWVRRWRVEHHLKKVPCKCWLVPFLVFKIKIENNWEQRLLWWSSG